MYRPKRTRLARLNVRSTVTRACDALLLQKRNHGLDLSGARRLLHSIAAPVRLQRQHSSTDVMHR